MTRILTILLILTSCTKIEMDRLRIKELKSDMEPSLVAEVIAKIDSAGILIPAEIIQRVAPCEGNGSLQSRLDFIRKYPDDRSGPRITRLYRPAAGAPIHYSTIHDILETIALYGSEAYDHPLDYSNDNLITMADIILAINAYLNSAMAEWTDINPQGIVILNPGECIGFYSTSFFAGAYGYTGDIPLIIDTCDGTYPVSEGKFTFSMGVAGAQWLYFRGANINP